MSQSQDKPLLEVYPWYLVVLLSVFWSFLWFGLWAALRGTAAAVVVALSPITDVSWYPWLVPAQLAVWLVSLAWVYRDIRNDRNPPPVVFSLCILLLATFPPTAFYMLRRVDSLSSFELTYSAASVILQKSLHQKVPDALALVLTLAIGSYTNLRVIRNKYSGTTPRNRKLIPIVWAVAVLVGIAAGRMWGTMWALSLMPAAGNAFTIYCFRETIREQIGEEGSPEVA